MGDRSKGLIGKFTVTRNDGQSASGEKHHHCRYYVLDLDHDPHAKPALAAYAKSARADGFTALADDLDKIVELWGPSQYFETENLGATIAELKMREQSVGSGSTGAPIEPSDKLIRRMVKVLDARNTPKSDDHHDSPEKMGYESFLGETARVLYGIAHSEEV